jgi:transposase
MPKRLEFELAESELLQVTEAICMDERPEVRQRAVAIRLLATGEKYTEVAGRLAVQPGTIRKWFQRFRQDGLEGLANRSRGRPKRKADQVYCQALEEAIQHGPGNYGYPFAAWTIERLRDHLEMKTGTYLSSSRLRMVIRNHGYIMRQRKQISIDYRIRS